mmetsp:Transcript_29017/g.72932  ORF Transcript_29017/g.72932 Transcript_29017/m.72932 type:complete len:205 (-) Transcript_29017:1686-2300(-)
MNATVFFRSARPITFILSGRTAMSLMSPFTKNEQARNFGVSGGLMMPFHTSLARSSSTIAPSNVFCSSSSSGNANVMTSVSEGMSAPPTPPPMLVLPGEAGGPRGLRSTDDALASTRGLLGASLASARDSSRGFFRGFSVLMRPISEGFVMTTRLIISASLRSLSARISAGTSSSADISAKTLGDTSPVRRSFFSSGFRSCPML